MAKFPFVNSAKQIPLFVCGADGSEMECSYAVFGNQQAVEGLLRVAQEKQKTCIVECFYDFVDFCWKVDRVRKDKSKPNSPYVAWKTMESLLAHVSLDQLHETMAKKPKWTEWKRARDDVPLSSPGGSMPDATMSNTTMPDATMSNTTMPDATVSDTVTNVLPQKKRPRMD